VIVSGLAEGEGFEPSRGLITPYSLSRRAPSATRSALRTERVYGRQAVVCFDSARVAEGYGRGVTPVEALERIAELLIRGRAPVYRAQAFRKAAREIARVPESELRFLADADRLQEL